MRSLRLDSDFEDAIERAAEARGESVSEFLRRAAADRVDATWSEDVEVRFADVLGVIHSRGGRARRTGRAFEDVVVGRRTST
jgi:hypothetical protein